jgi:hypothetical protein
LHCLRAPNLKSKMDTLVNDSAGVGHLSIA